MTVYCMVTNVCGLLAVLFLFQRLFLVTFFWILPSRLKLMTEVGIDDFSLKDLIRPEGPRLRLHLSAIINFTKFREEQLAVFEDFSRRSEELVEQRNKLAAREAELSGKITYFK